MTSTDDDGIRPDPADDDALEAEMRALLARMDPVPGRVLHAARAAWTWRTIDQELADLSALAELTHDSLLEEGTLLAGVRGPATTRVLTFESPEPPALTLEVEVSASGSAARRLVGQLIPPAAAGVVVELREGGIAATGEADDLGRFVLLAEGSGDARLRFTLADGAQVRTAWTLL
jgi:hypothetical protein